MKAVVCFIFVLSACAIITYAEEESKCNTACTSIYRPVCAQSPRDGTKTTFASDCVLGIENCRQKEKDPSFQAYSVVSQGECEK